MASPNFSEIMATTIAHRSKKVADNVTKNNALLTRLSKKGKVKTFPGGINIVQEIEYAENSTFKRYSGYELLNIAPSEVITAAEFGIKQAVVSVSMNGLEMLQNSGEDAILDLMEARIGNAERTLTNNLAADVYSDGTADSGKQMGGLALLVADTPTSGTVGSINRATWPFWRNLAFSGLTDGGQAISAGNIQSYMNSMFFKLSRGADKPDLIVADTNLFSFYVSSMQAIQKIDSNSDVADAGFTTVKFMGVDVVLDGAFGGNAPTNRMYFLNTDYLFYRPHASRNIVAIGGDRQNSNQDAVNQLIGWAGNMTMSNASLQGVLKA